jgi:predicted DNA-binding WGR domain protein
MHKTEILAGSHNNGSHNFYRMELIHRRGSDLYILFTNWGRIGENPGQFQSTPFGSLAEAEKEFNSIFLRCSGNKWENIDNFVEKPNKYRLITLTENSIENIAELEINLKFHEEEKGKYKEDMTEEETLYCFIKDISNVKRMQEKARMV